LRTKVQCHAHASPLGGNFEGPFPLCGTAGRRVTQVQCHAPASGLFRGETGPCHAPAFQPLRQSSTLACMTGEATVSTEVALGELGTALSAMRLCAPRKQEQMRLSLSKLGQVTPVQAYRVGARLELFDGLKRLRAARELSWPKLRAEVHTLEAVGAKVRLWRCNADAGLSELEEGWLVRSLYREDALTQPQIAMLMERHKSWVCRRLALAEDLSDELTANVRLGLISATAAGELGRLQRCNQDEVAGLVARCGLTTRQVARLVDTLLAAPKAEWPRQSRRAPAGLGLPTAWMPAGWALSPVACWPASTGRWRPDLGFRRSGCWAPRSSARSAGVGASSRAWSLWPIGGSQAQRRHTRGGHHEERRA